MTLVAVGHLVQTALAVAAELADQDISVEVFDPRSVYPFDWALLRSSVGKTGRLVVADDTNRTCGLAGEIIATVAEEMPLHSRPRRVTRADVAVPQPATVIVSVAADKVDFDVEAGVEGTVEEILVIEGTVVEVGTVIARIREET